VKLIKRTICRDISSLGSKTSIFDVFWCTDFGKISDSSLPKPLQNAEENSTSPSIFRADASKGLVWTVLAVAGICGCVFLSALLIYNRWNRCRANPRVNYSNLPAPPSPRAGGASFLANPNATMENVPLGATGVSN